MKYKSFWMSYADLDPKHNAVIDEFADGIEVNIKARLLELGVNPDANSPSAIQERVKYLDQYILNRLKDPTEVEIAKCLVAHKFAFLTNVQSLIVTLECLSSYLTTGDPPGYDQAAETLKSLTPKAPNYPYVLVREAGEELLKIIDTTLLIIERQIRIGNLRPNFYLTLPGRPEKDDVLSFLVIQEIDIENASSKISNLRSRIEWNIGSGVS